MLISTLPLACIMLHNLTDKFRNELSPTTAVTVMHTVPYIIVIYTITFVMHTVCNVCNAYYTGIENVCNAHRTCL